MRILLPFLAAALLAIAPTQAMAAVCNPSDTSTPPCVNQDCATIGVTQMDKDQKNILACLKKDVGAGSIWKSYSVPYLVCPAGQAVSKIENGKAVCEAVSGGSIGAGQAKNVGTIYQADKDGFLVTVCARPPGDYWSYHMVYTGHSSPPTFRAGYGKAVAGFGSLATTTTPISKGMFYRVVNEFGHNPESITFYPLN